MVLWLVKHDFTFISTKILYLGQQVEVEEGRIIRFVALQLLYDNLVQSRW